jgi:hypothetical protein
VCFSHFSRFSVFFFCLISHHTVCVSHFPWFLVLLPYSRSYRVYFAFSNFFSVSRNIPGHTVFVSHFPLFSVFLHIIQFLQCVFLIFRDFQYSHHTPGPTVCIYLFSCFSELP